MSRKKWPARPFFFWDDSRLLNYPNDETQVCVFEPAGYSPAAECGNVDPGHNEGVKLLAILQTLRQAELLTMRVCALSSAGLNG